MRSSFGRGTLTGQKLSRKFVTDMTLTKKGNLFSACQVRTEEGVRITDSNFWPYTVRITSLVKSAKIRLMSKTSIAHCVCKSPLATTRLIHNRFAELLRHLMPHSPVVGTQPDSAMPEQDGEISAYCTCTVLCWEIALQRC